MSNVRRFIEFLAPLVFSNVATSISEQVLNVGILIAGSPTLSAYTLAAFGLASYVQKWVCSFVAPSKSLGTNIGGLSCIYFVWFEGLACGVMLLLLSMFGTSVLFGRDEDLLGQIRFATVCLAPLPLLYGLGNVYAGVLLRRRRSTVVAASYVAEVAAQAVAIFVVLRVSPVTSPLAVPLIAAHVGAVTRVSIVVVACWSASVDGMKSPEWSLQQRTTTFGEMVGFSWPLICNELGSRTLRPIVNWVVLQTATPEAVAVLMLCYPVVNVGYAWLMELKQLPASFANEQAVTSRNVLVCSVSCCLMSLLLMFGISWTAFETWLFVNVLRTSAALADEACATLRILSFLPVPVTVRAYYYGWASFYKRTNLLAPAAFVKCLALLASLWVLKLVGLRGATLGAAGLLCAFLSEAAAVSLMCTRHGLHTEWLAK